jgi:hypothetical protein
MLYPGGSVRMADDLTVHKEKIPIVPLNIRLSDLFV